MLAHKITDIFPFDIDEAGGFTFAMPSSEASISVGGSFSSFNTFQIDGQDVVPVDQWVMGVDGGDLFAGFGASAEQNFLQTDLNKWVSRDSDFLYGTSYNGGLAEAYVLLDGANTKAVYVDTKQLADNSSSNWFSYKQMGESAVLYHTTAIPGAYGTYDYYLLDFDNLAAGGHIFDSVDDFEFVGTFNGNDWMYGPKGFLSDGSIVWQQQVDSPFDGLGFMTEGSSGETLHIGNPSVAASEWAAQNGLYEALTDSDGNVSYTQVGYSSMASDLIMMTMELSVTY